MSSCNQLDLQALGSFRSYYTVTFILHYWPELLFYFTVTFYLLLYPFTLLYFNPYFGFGQEVDLWEPLST